MAENKPEQPEFRMQKMYVKDLSFENPGAPEVYLNQGSEPKVELNLQLNNKKIDDIHWEVSLEVNAKVSADDGKKTLFVLELEHAAIFLLKNIPEEHMAMVLGVDCPTLLFPFTRQIASQVSVDGGFAPFLMEPVNFMALFQNAKKQQEEKPASN
ncbi:MAG: protein-export chaperone SecB [Desulfotalea sp.]